MSDLYQIENNFLIIQIASHGAELKQFYSKKWKRELIWNPREEHLQKIWNRSSPVLFPFVGRLKENSYIWGGKKYQINQHGFARDMEFKCIERNTNEISFLLEATQETYSHYPFLFELRARFILDGQKLKINYSVTNCDRQNIYFSIGAHPGFVLDNLNEYEIQFEKTQKEYFQLKNGLVDWNQPKELKSGVITPDKNTFADDALIFKNVKSQYIDLVNRVKSETIRVNGTNTPFLGIWGKESVPFVCIEPWYGVGDDLLTNQLLEEKNGIQKLEENKTFHFSYSIELI